ncbi:MAG: TIR domain-containing protein [Chloroflexi bacterium]|nr:TIR domain-containing protein [Chloroflexota bacterium]
MNPTDVFISYRRTDVEFTKTIVEALAKTGRELWIDWDDIPPGVESFTDEIQRGIEGANAFIAILSPSYLESEYCIGELKEALRLKKRIIPIVYKKFDPAPPPEGIGHINWVYFTPHAGQKNTFEEAFPKVEQALVADYENAREHTRILLRAIDWEKHGGNRSYYLKGKEIDKAEAWQVQAINKDPLPIELQGEYILNSRKYQRKQRQRITIAISILLVLVVIAGSIAYIQGRISHSQALASAALQPGNEDIAMALALEATRGEFVHGDVSRILEEIAYPIGGIVHAYDIPTENPASEIKYPAISPDGQRIIIENRIYNLKTQELMLTIDSVPGIILKGAYLPDGKHFVLTGDDEGVFDPDANPVFLGLYDAATGTLVRKFDTGIGVSDIQISGDGQILIGYQPDGKAIWWDVETGAKLREFETDGKTRFSPDLTWLAHINAEGTELKVIDTVSMSEVSSIQLLPSSFYISETTSLEVSPDATMIAVSMGSEINTYLVPDGNYFTELSPLNTHASCFGKITSIRYDPGSSMIVAGCTDNTISLWAVLGDLLTKQVAHKDVVNFADFVMGGERVVSSDISNYVLEWNALPGNVKKRLAGTSVDFAEFSEDGQYLFLKERKDDQVDIIAYDTSELQESERQTLSVSSNTSFYFSQGMVSGKMVYVEEEKVIVAEVSSGDHISQWKMDGLQDINTQFISDGSKLLINYQLEGDAQKLEIRDVNTGALILDIIPELSNGTNSFAITPDGTKLLFSETEFDISNDGPPSRETPIPSKANSRLIDIATGDTILIFDNEYFPMAIFTPDGAQFVYIPTFGNYGTQKNTTLRIWDAVTGEFIRELFLPNQTPSTFAFHPDGKSFFTARRIGGGGGGPPPTPSGIFRHGISFIAKANFHQWDFESGDLIREFPLQVTDIKVSLDGKFFITNAFYRGGEFRVWRLDTQDELVDWACENRFVSEFSASQMELYRITTTKSVCD